MRPDPCSGIRSRLTRRVGSQRPAAAARKWWCARAGMLGCRADRRRLGGRRDEQPLPDAPAPTLRNTAAARLGAARAAGYANELNVT